jgi:hypothetical protein
MKEEIFQDNKARWEVFEWIGSTQSKVIWAVVLLLLGAPRHGLYEASVESSLAPIQRS